MSEREKLIEEVARTVDAYAFRELTGSDLRSDDYAITNQRDRQNGAKKRVRKYLSAIEQAGFKVVPVEPSEEMKEVVEHLDDRFPTIHRDEAAEIYKAMLEASPIRGE